MNNKYSEFEQNLNPGGHLLNLDDETWEEVNEYLVSGKGDELLVAVRESLKSGEFESSDNETEESDEENRSQAKLYTMPEREKSEGSDEDQKLIEYLPESSREHEVIGKWLSLMEDKEKGLIPIDKNKDINLCGDLELDNEVASILLDTVKTRLPNFHCRHTDGTEVHGRNFQGLKKRKIQLLPLHLFSINWALTAPGLDWPETYLVTYVPGHNVRIVTASQDSDDCWGHTDLAIGFCKPHRSPEFGVKKVFRSWWSQLPNAMHPWAVFTSAGLIDEDRAEKWCGDIYGSRDKYIDYC